jgi:N-acetylmuramoyl-L-alanine amidase
MLDKIAAFFKNIFSGLFGAKETTPVNPGKTTPPTRTIKDLPKAEPDFPQDAPEVITDKDAAKAVEVVDEKELVILEPGDDPSDVPISDSTKPEVATKPDIVTPPVVVTTPTIDAEPKHKARYTWCLDNGHGKQTAGKRSPKFEDGKQFLEYEFNRDLVKRVSKQLDENGVKYFIVVPEVDIDNFLEGRVDRANNFKSTLPKIFLSVHSNAFGNSGWESPSGIETWFFHDSRSGRALASVFQKHLVAKLGWKNRKLKSYPGSKQFYVLRNTKMPAVLTENGFYTNKEETRLLLQDATRQKIADAHVTAILEIEKNGI